mgnify:CR=1 FL=1
MKGREDDRLRWASAEIASFRWPSRAASVWKRVLVMEKKDLSNS